MNVPAPDRLVLDVLDRYSQLTTSHVRELVFSTAKSRTTCDRVLARMYRDGYIDRASRRRLIGGAEGGSGEFVWTLGTHGWRLVGREGRYRPRAISYHSLAISDAVVRLHLSERAGEVIIRSIVSEPDCWLMVQGIDLRPDLAVELERPGTGAKLAAFIEVDLGTERASRITEKLTRYMDAYRRATNQDMAELRRIVFVCENEPRRREIEWLIGKLSEEQAKYFRSVLLETFPKGM